MDALAVLAYPHATLRQKRQRVQELSNLGIKSVSFSGSATTLGKVSVLGKGYAGVVMLARDEHNKYCAVKARRTDSPRKNMTHEVARLKQANQEGVGPKLYAHSRNFIVMEYVKGQRISDWIECLNGPGTVARLKQVIRLVITDCYRLDMRGVDHGEISNISKHVIIYSRNDKPVIIDFESASDIRKPSNVTSITQSIFISSPIAKKVQRIYKKTLPSKDQIISSLREYKNSPNKQTFDMLLETLKL